MDNEIFVDIKGYEGLYQVSNLGRVKSLNYNCTKEEKLLKTDKSTNGKGYHKVFLCKDGKRQQPLIHRLVAFHFIPIPEHLKDIPIKELEINHKDENKENNYVDNLEWCTAKYNINYGSRTQKVVEKKSKQVYQYDKDLNLIQVWKSTAECERNGYNHQHISNCCLGKRHSHKGCIWSYDEIKKSQAS